MRLLNRTAAISSALLGLAAAAYLSRPHSVHRSHAPTFGPAVTNPAVAADQHGTYLGDGEYRWMASGTIDKFGNIGMGYSFGGASDFAGQRLQDYSTAALDPDDDCTVWNVGDYFKKDATSYSTKIGAFKRPWCK